MTSFLFHYSLKVIAVCRTKNSRCREQKPKQVNSQKADVNGAIKRENNTEAFSLFIRGFGKEKRKRTVERRRVPTPQAPDSTRPLQRAPGGYRRHEMPTDASTLHDPQTTPPARKDIDRQDTRAFLKCSCIAHLPVDVHTAVGHAAVVKRQRARYLIFSAGWEIIILLPRLPTLTLIQTKQPERLIAVLRNVQC